MDVSGLKSHFAQVSVDGRVSIVKRSSSDCLLSNALSADDEALLQCEY